jgi:hypothetical protein
MENSMPPICAAWRRHSSPCPAPSKQVSDGAQGSRQRPGEQRLKKAVRSLRGRPRKDNPVPYDDTWGWWVQERIVTLEHKVNLILTLATTAVLAELFRIVLEAFGLLK